MNKWPWIIKPREPIIEERGFKKSTVTAIVLVIGWFLLLIAFALHGGIR